MAKDPTRPIARTRTEDLRKEIESAAGAWSQFRRSRNLGWWVLIWGAFVAVVGFVVVWTRTQPMVADGRIIPDTITAGVGFEIIDSAATEQARLSARAQAPRVYVASAGVLSEVLQSIESLPETLRNAASPEDVDPAIRQQFGVNEAVLSAAKRQIEDSGEVRASWKAAVARLGDRLTRTPMLARETFQLESQALSKRIELRTAQGQSLFVPSGSIVNVEAPELSAQMRGVVGDPQIPSALQEAIATRLAHQPRPTFTFDAAATVENQDAAAQSVSDTIVRYPAREPIARRGDMLTATQLAVIRASLQAETSALTPAQLWSKRGSELGVVAAITLALAGYTVLFVPKVRRNPVRLAALAGLLAAMVLVACYATAMQPGLIALTGAAPTVLCAMIVCIAYNQRAAIGYGALHALLVCLALDQPVGLLAIMITGIGAAAWRLREVRERDTLINAGLVLALALAGGTLLVELYEMPLNIGTLRQAAWDAGLAGFGGLLVAGLTLFILPTLERTFGITTGLTLIELRDPKQPLLRELQQRAPGTYNHSLTLATLGEAAAEEINADGLLTYVGALYHDIGKMNKPEYFVENQSPGINRHDKLSPAMSLLIIVGHVKDGLELAREFNLPRPLWHFIESHHGTTLVEYFYHRARRQAEGAGPGGAGGGDAPTELEYRYPGPRPRTKEAAIIMICDAVESAARAMADPTPSRIETLVRAIATKRLMDGQFDECDLTLRELNLIVESVSRTLASIYHGRIQYPGEPSSAPSSGSRTRAEQAGGATVTAGGAAKTAVGLGDRDSEIRSGT